MPSPPPPRGERGPQPPLAQPGCQAGKRGGQAGDPVLLGGARPPSAGSAGTLGIGTSPGGSSDCRWPVTARPRQWPSALGAEVSENQREGGSGTQGHILLRHVTTMGIRRVVGPAALVSSVSGHSLGDWSAGVWLGPWA